MEHSGRRERWRRSDRIAWRIVEGEAYLMDPDTSTLSHLNPVGTFIWELLDGSRSPADIVAALGAEFAVDEPTAERDVAAFIGLLAGRGLVSCDASVATGDEDE